MVLSFVWLCTFIVHVDSFDPLPDGNGCCDEGNILNCDIFSSEIINSSLFESNLFGASDVADSKIEDSYVSKNVMCKDSYVFGVRGVFSGEMEGGIFRKGRATKMAKFENTEIIEIEKI